MSEGQIKHAMATFSREFEQTMAEALHSFNAGRLSESETTCRRLLMQDPQNPAVHQILAVLALDRNDLSAARSHVIQSLERRPQHGPTLLLAGKIARAAADLTTAAHFFERASALMPVAAEPDLLLGATLVDLGSAGAIPVLERLLSRYEQDANGWCLLGLALRRHGDAGSALEAFRKAVGCDARMAKAHFYLATEMYAHGLVLEAIPVFRQAQELDPSAMEVVFNLGLALHKAGQAEEARRAFESTIAIAPSYADAWFNLGLACQDLDDLDSAAAAFRAALEHRPDYAEAAVNLGITLQDARRMDDAMQAYRLAVRLRPETFGRVAHALTVGSTGQLWLSVDDLRHALTD